MIDAKSNAIDFTYTEDNPNGEFQLATVSYARRSVTLTYEKGDVMFLRFKALAAGSAKLRIQAVDPLALNGMAPEVSKAEFHLQIE